MTGPTPPTTHDVQEAFAHYWASRYGSFTNAWIRFERWLTEDRRAIPRPGKPDAINPDRVLSDYIAQWPHPGSRGSWPPPPPEGYPLSQAAYDAWTRDPG